MSTVCLRLQSPDTGQMCADRLGLQEASFEAGGRQQAAEVKLPTAEPVVSAESRRIPLSERTPQKNTD